VRADRLPEIGGPAILGLQAGNVKTGAFDPLGALCAADRAACPWVHVDGAFGLWAAAVPELRGRCAGVERADDSAIDAHKWLRMRFDSGLAFVRDGDILRAAMSVSAADLPSSAARSPSDTTPELSRRARGVDISAMLSALGRSGVLDMINRCCRYARHFAEGFA
jgi:glutamate/tyrosine decarboxylase-like PLP-dependent enzyme